MKTITINVEDFNYEKVRDLLQHLTYVKSFNVFENSGTDLLNDENIIETAHVHKKKHVLKKKLVNPSRPIFVKVDRSLKPQKDGIHIMTFYEMDKDYEKLQAEFMGKIEGVKTGQDVDEVDEITLLSEASLAEDWDSEEDDRYDEYYRSKYLKNDVPKG